MTLKPDATRVEIVARINEQAALIKVLLEAHPLGITLKGDVVVRNHLVWPHAKPKYIGSTPLPNSANA